MSLTFSVKKKQKKKHLCREEKRAGSRRVSSEKPEAAIVAFHDQVVGVRKRFKTNTICEQTRQKTQMVVNPVVPSYPLEM